jgi:hypothetical protein
VDVHARERNRTNIPEDLFQMRIIKEQIELRIYRESRMK